METDKVTKAERINREKLKIRLKPEAVQNLEAV